MERQGCGLDVVVAALNHAEEHSPVGEEECCAPQFLAKGGVVQEEEVLQQQQPRHLVVGVLGHQFAQLVQRLLVESFGV